MAVLFFGILLGDFVSCDQKDVSKNKAFKQT